MARFHSSGLDRASAIEQGPPSFIAVGNGVAAGRRFIEHSREIGKRHGRYNTERMDEPYKLQGDNKAFSSHDTEFACLHLDGGCDASSLSNNFQSTAGDINVREPECEAIKCPVHQYLRLNPAHREWETTKQRLLDQIPAISRSISRDSAVTTADIYKKLPEAPDGGLMFTPVYLHNWTLWVFSLQLILLGVALAVLYHFSLIENGLSIRLSSNHYYWTYGPTAFIVIISGFWRQVDYWCKALIPWQVMMGRPSTAEKSILLDYISPPFYTSLWTAGKYRHWVILCSISGGILLKLMATFSTSLLVLQSTAMNEVVDLVMTTKFDPSNINWTSVSGKEANIDNSAIYVYFGIVNQSLPFPNGTSLTMASQSFEPSNAKLNTTFSATIMALYPDLDCAPGIMNATVLQNDTDPLFEGTVTYEAKSISGNCTVRSASLFGEDHSEIQKHLSVGFYSPCQENANDTIWLFGVLDLRYNKTPDNMTHPVLVAMNQTNSGFYVAATSAITCRANYTMRNVTVALDPSLARTPFNLNITEISDPDVNASRMMRLNDIQNLVDSITSGATQFPTLFNGSNIDNGTRTAWDGFTWFSLMSLENNGSDLTPFLDNTLLARSVRNVYRGIASQVAADLLLVPSNDSFKGEMQYEEPRLHVRLLSVALMEGCLILVLCLTLFIIKLRPNSTIPRDPTSVASILALVAGSDGFKTVLQHTSYYSNQKLLQRLKKHEFWTDACYKGDGTTKPAFLISSTGDLERITHHAVKESSIRDKPNPKWRPLQLHPVIQILCLTLSIGIILLLEVLQRISDRNSGLFIDTTISYGPLDVQSLSSYLPAAIMLSIITLYTSLDEAVSIIAPFNLLRRFDKSQVQYMSASFLGMFPPVAIWQSLKYRHAAVAFAATASLIGSILTIVVSGLYTTIEVSFPQNFSLLRSDIFDLTNMSSNNQAAIIYSLIEQHNLTYPAFTFEDLVFPALQIELNTSTTNFYSGGHLTTQLPALRARLECNTLTNTSISITNNSAEDIQALTSADVPVPATCLGIGQYANESSLQLSLSFNFPNVGSNNTVEWATIFGGGIVDLHVGPYLNYTYFGEEVTTYSLDNPEGCPTLGIGLGQFFRNGGENRSTYTALVCNQLIQEVSTYVTLLLPSLAIDPLNPPIPDENTAHYLTKGMENTFTRSYRPQINLATAPEYTSLANNSLSARFGSIIFSSILYGPSGIPGEELVGPQNIRRLESAIQQAYAQYMAQAITSGMRQPISSSQTSAERAIGGENTDIAFTGTIVDATQRRLVQNSISKILLQAILAVMVFCAIATYLAIGRQGFLIHNPSSIAGVASLLTESVLNNRLLVPSGVEWMTQQELEEWWKRGGWKFRLGWLDGGKSSNSDNENSNSAAGRRGCHDSCYGIYAVKDEIVNKTVL